MRETSLMSAGLETMRNMFVDTSAGDAGLRSICHAKDD